jgi:hypothetical protein
MASVIVAARAARPLAPSSGSTSTIVSQGARVVAGCCQGEPQASRSMWPLQLTERAANSHQGGLQEGCRLRRDRRAEAKVIRRAGQATLSMGLRKGLSLRRGMRRCAS